jgi:glucosamine--fructose-6-phosphate aminotransferase (isomerizing)
VISNLQEIKARGGIIISIGFQGDNKLKEMSDEFIELPKMDWASSPLLFALPVQLIAYYVALSLGTDIDKPRNLAKSVTVE